MATTFSIYINSGEIDATTYTKGDNLSMLEVSNSDNEYYQSGFIELYDVATQHNINDTVLVTINNTQQFSGYISSREQTINKGKALTRYQLIGETYDLWRYHTDEYALYSGTTLYIASSLVSSYCENITAYQFDMDAGEDLTNDLDLSNLTVGDALIELTNIDGYSFYVNNGELHYYKNTNTTSSFTVTESNIIEMDPIEESDEDIVNDVLVLGGSDYSVKTTVSPKATSSKIFPSGVLIAQRFNAEDPVLSAVRLYLNRSTGDDAPSELLFEIWENTEMVVFEDDFTNEDYLSTTTNLEPTDNFLMLSVVSSCRASWPSKAGGTHSAKKWEFGHKSHVDGCFHRFRTRGFITRNGIYYICPSGSDGKPDISQAYTSGTCKVGDWVYYYPRQVRVNSDEFVCLVLGGNWDFNTNVWIEQIATATDHNKCQYDGYYTIWVDDGGGTTSKCWMTFDLLEFKTDTGYASSNSYTHDTQYMRVDLEGVVSSQRIYISGTNDGGTTWKTMTDGSWVDFGSESSAGSYIKYKFSSNGYFTPRIDSATVTISDDSGGLDQVVFTDDFSDETKLSSNSINGLRITEGWEDNFDSDIAATALMISGLVLRDVDGSDTLINDSDWDSNPSYMFDNNTGTYALVDNIYKPVDFVDSCIFTDKPLTVCGVKLKYDLQRDGMIDDFWIRLSSNTSTWTTRMNEKSNLWLGAHGGSPNVDGYYKFNVDVYYSGTQGIQSYFNNLDNCAGGPGKLLHYDLRAITIPNEGFYAGTAKSINYDLGLLTYYYIKLDVTETYGNYITYSGSLDGGANWDKLTKNTSTLISNPGSNLVIMYCIQPSSNYLGNGSGNVKFPNIDSVTCTVETTQGGGIPKSGSKIEWSDDIGFTDNDLPYAPNYSNWQTYTSPKLSGLTTGDSYWMIFEHSSSPSDEDYEVVSGDFNQTLDEWDASSSHVELLETNEIRFGSLNYAGTANAYIYAYNIPVWDGLTSLYVEGVNVVDDDARVWVYWRPTGTDSWTSFGYYYRPEGSYITFGTLDKSDISSYNLIDIRFRVNDDYTGHANLYADEINIIVTSSQKFWSYFYDPNSEYDGKISYSWDGGVKWSSNVTYPSEVPDGNMRFQLGWTQGEIQATATNQESIDLYGRHFKKINDSTITTLERAQARADLEVSGMTEVPKKGKFVITGRTDMSNEYMFSANLTNFGIDEKFDIKEYTQRIDKKGFTTEIVYGRHTFDLAKKVSELEYKQSK